MPKNQGTSPPAPLDIFAVDGKLEVAIRRFDTAMQVQKEEF